MQIQSRFLMVSLAVGASAHSFGQWTVTQLPLNNVSSGIAYGCNSSSQVGSVVPPNGQDRAIIWHGAGSTVDLHPTGARFSSADDCTNDIQVGYADFGANANAGYWRGTSPSWVNLHPIGFQSSSIDATDGDQHVGTAFRNGSIYAGLWDTTGSFTNLSPFIPLAFANDVSNGVQVGGYGDVNLIRACRWNGTAESFVDVHPVGYHRSSLAAIDGTNFVGSAGRSTEWDHAVLWKSDGTFVDLHVDRFELSRAIDAEHDIQIGYVGDHCFGGGYYSECTQAGFWRGSKESWHSLHQYLPTHYSTSQAKAIFADESGITIVGFAINDQLSRIDPIMWHSPVPEPSTLLICSLGASALALRRKVKASR